MLGGLLQLGGLEVGRHTGWEAGRLGGWEAGKGEGIGLEKGHDEAGPGARAIPKPMQAQGGRLFWSASTETQYPVKRRRMVPHPASFLLTDQSIRSPASGGSIFEPLVRSGSKTSSALIL